MRTRTGFIVGFVAGYLLGARAGREQYDVIMRRVRAVKERPEVQEAAGVVTAQAGGFVQKVRSLAGGRSGGREGGGRSTVTYGESVHAHSPNGSGGVG